MKKNQTFIISVLFLLALLTISVAYLSDSKLTGFAVIEQKLEFSQGENFLAVVSGNFIDRITNENVFFYSGHERIPLIYEVLKINEDYYISAMLSDKQQGNYSLVIKNIRYKKGLQETDEDIIKNFTITNDTADFYVNPGVLTSSEDFSIEIQNIQDKKLTITIRTPEELSASENSVELTSGQAKSVNFRINKNNIKSSSSIEKIEFSSENTFYSLPVFMTGLEVSEEVQKTGFRFEPETFKVSLATNSDTKRIIYLLNNEDEIKDINLSISPSLLPYVNFSPSFLETLKNNSAEKIEVLINSSDDEKNITGWLTASKGNLSSSTVIFLSFVKGLSPEIDEGSIISTCEQLDGVICAEGERCTEQTIETRDGLCCRATCEKVTKSSAGKYLGWAIIIILLLILFWFFAKYKKTH